MTLFNCDNPLNIASTPYVDCVVTTVSGHLQEQISSSPGIWTELASFSTSIPNKDTMVTVSGLPPMDLLKIFVAVVGLDFDIGTSSFGFSVYFNDDTNNANYINNNRGVTVVNPNEADFFPANSFIERTILNLETTEKIPTVDGAFFSPTGNPSNSGEIPSVFLDVWDNTNARISSMTFKFPLIEEITTASIDVLKVKICGMNF